MLKLNYKLILILFTPMDAQRLENNINNILAIITTLFFTFWPLAVNIESPGTVLQPLSYFFVNTNIYTKYYLFTIKNQCQNEVMKKNIQLR